MQSFLTFCGLLVIPGGLLAAGQITGDATRGEQFLRDRGCIACHTVDGAGGGSAPDLARSLGRNYTVASLTSVLANHAPAWSQCGRDPGNLTAANAADLFAFFYSKRYFDRPGDARRGKQVFTARQCSHCHGVRERLTPEISALVEWGSRPDPACLSRRLDPQEIADLGVYIRALTRQPTSLAAAPAFTASAGDSHQGRRVFERRKCTACHTAETLRTIRTDQQTAAAICLLTAIWNHRDAMTAEIGKRGFTWPRVSGTEMAHLGAYLVAPPVQSGRLTSHPNSQ